MISNTRVTKCSTTVLDCTIWRVLIALSLMLCAPALHAQGSRRTVELTISRDSALWVVEDSTDSIYTSPNGLLASDHQLLVTDPIGQAVISLDQDDGSVNWRYSKPGRGPGEMTSPALAAWHPDGFLVADTRNVRLYLFSRNGSLIREQPVPGGLFVSGLCSLNDGSVLLNIAGPAPQALIRTRLGSQDFDPYPFPFTTKIENMMGGSMDLSSQPPESSVCLGARNTEDGMAVLTSSKPIKTGSFVEHVEQRPYMPPAAMRDTSDLPIMFSHHAWVDGHRALVWFGGKECASRCIDVYHFPSLRYIGSIRLSSHSGFSVRDVASADGDLFILGSQDVTPMIMAFRMPDLPGQ